MSGDLLKLVAARGGHFRLESGHHGDLWLDLDRLFLRPALLRPAIAELAGRLAGYGLDAVCGPLVGGALVAQSLAAELDIEFLYAERVTAPRADALYSAEYRIPRTLPVEGRRVAVVDDVVNAGSAMRATLADLDAVGARPAAVGALLVLGTPATQLAADRGLPLVSVASRDNRIWPPAECSLCAAGTPLEDFL